MKRLYSLSLASLAVLTALPAVAASSFIGSDDDSANNVTEDTTINATGVLTYTNSDKTKDYALFGIFPNGKSVSFTGKNIAVNVNARGYVETSSRESLQGVGIDALDGSKVTLGAADSNVKFAINSDVAIMGIRSGSGSYVEVNGASLVMNAESFGTTPDTGSVYGLYAQNFTEDPNLPEDRRATLIVNSENTYISVKSASEGAAGALVAMSQGILKVNGNLYATGDKVVIARGDAIVRINESNTKTVQLTGDVDFNYDKETSGTRVDADVLINLTGADSFWHGSATVSYGSGSTSDEMMTVSGLKLGISNDAHWTPVLVEEYGDDSSGLMQVAINDLTLNNGIINLNHGEQQTLRIQNLHGAGGTINIATTAHDDGTFSTPMLYVETVESTPDAQTTLTLKYNGITSDDLSADAAADLKQLAAQSLTLGEGESVAQIRRVEEGNIRGAVVQTVSQAGEIISTNEADNTKLTSYSAVNAMSLVQWRNEINHLTKRLGDIRAAEGTIGAWARVYGGESQWGGGNEVEMDHTTIQVGGDYRVNNHWIVGGAFSYTDSDADLAKGAATGDSYSLAAYATYMADGGSFLDLIARYGYLKNDIDSGNMSLETGSSAFSLTAEMGHTFRFMEERAYIEPQVEFTYGFVSGDDDTASNGVKIEQDDFQSFVTRVGVRTGFDFPKKAGTIYGMVSYSYDFLGDADGMASEGNLRQALSEDLGGGWVSYGIGAQVMFGKSSYFYGELERTSGGEVDNPYLFNAGVRITF